jgi:pimeloyl-ACP methyl ester carboxylesterase
MPSAKLDSGIELEYETFGSRDDPALLLIMGFTAQMTLWPVDLCTALAGGGRFVIRFDNRDCGLSSKLDGVAVDTEAAMMAAYSGQPAPEVPYLLSDMAADAVGLLDALGIDVAHVMGASMGGMIAQTVAINHADRCLSMISVMSTTGDLSVGQAAPEALAALLAPPPTDRQSYIEAADNFLVFASKKYGDAAENRARAAASFDRSFYPEGSRRQLAAIMASGDRSSALTQLDVPTLVIHGRDDTLIDKSGGIRTAELIPGANLLLVADMGHDLPAPLLGTITDAILSHTHRAPVLV